MPEFVSRAGAKLEHALTALNINPAHKICADLGCSTGGFTDCLLQHDVAKVYAIDTGYGVLDWKLRKNPRVIVMERTNAMHVKLPEKVDLITIDVGWTRQKNILPSAADLLAAGGIVITLIKPHYEADPSQLNQGVLPDELVDPLVATVKQEIERTGWRWQASVPSPIRGTGGNQEILATLIRAS